MSNCGTTTESVFRNVEWTSSVDASGPILRRAALGAVVSESRLELSYDWERGEYDLGTTVVTLTSAF